MPQCAALLRPPQPQLVHHCLPRAAASCTKLPNLPHPARSCTCWPTRRPSGPPAAMRWRRRKRRRGGQPCRWSARWWRRWWTRCSTGGAGWSSNLTGFVTASLGQVVAQVVDALFRQVGLGWGSELAKRKHLPRCSCGSKIRCRRWWTPCLTGGLGLLSDCIVLLLRALGWLVPPHRLVDAPPPCLCLSRCALPSHKPRPAGCPLLGSLR